MESLMKPGSQLNRLIHSLGLSDQVGIMIGAALDRKIAGNAGIASNLFDAFSPLSSRSLNSKAIAPFGFVGRPYNSYLRNLAEYQKFYQPSLNLPFSPANYHEHVRSLLSRINPNDINAVINNMAASLQSLSGQSLITPNLSIDQQLGQLLQGFVGRLQNSIQEKLNAINAGLNAQAPAMKKKKKKKGIGGKLKKVGKGLKKGFKKIGKVAKGITKVGKGLFKGVLQGIKGIFKGGLLPGLFQLGGGLLGGLAGGPIGALMLSKIGGKKGAKFFQVFEQMNKMFSVVGNLQSGMNQFNLQNLSKMIRI